MQLQFCQFSIQSTEVVLWLIFQMQKKIHRWFARRRGVSYPLFQCTVFRMQKKIHHWFACRRRVWYPLFQCTVDMFSFVACSSSACAAKVRETNEHAALFMYCRVNLAR